MGGVTIQATNLGDPTDVGGQRKTESSIWIWAEEANRVRERERE